MPSRTPRAAAQALLEPYQDIVRCVTDIGLVARRNQQAGRHTAQFLQQHVVLRRRRGLNPIRFGVTLDYVISEATERTGWWQASLTSWVYEVLDSEGRHILAFHWHATSGRVTWPHLHAYGSNESVELHKLHPPTGTVTAGSVVRFLIEDLDVLPRRPNWQAVLDHHAAV